jgi:hypothetical protein
MRVHPYVRSGLVAVVIAAAAGLFALSFTTSDSGDGPTLPSGVHAIEPIHQALISPQGTIGVDLADDHTGVLLIGGQEVPEDQLVRVAPLGQLSFNPGPDKDVERFEAGTHTATVVYWPVAESRDAAQRFTWIFRVG